MEARIEQSSCYFIKILKLDLYEMGDRKFLVDDSKKTRDIEQF